MEPWLVVIDMQHAFGDPTSGWYAEGYDAITPVVDEPTFSKWTPAH